MVSLHYGYVVRCGGVDLYVVWRACCSSEFVAVPQSFPCCSCGGVVVVRPAMGIVVGTYRSAHMRGCIGRFVGMAWNFFAYQRTMFG